MPTTLGPRPHLPSATCVSDVFPFAGERTLLGLAARQPNRLRRRVVLATPAVVLTVTVAVQALLDGSGTDDLIRGWRDLISLISHRTTRSGDGDPHFPILRDILSLIGLYSLALTPFLMNRMWLNYARMLATMHGNGALRVHPAAARAKVNASVTLCNDRMRRVGLLGVITIIVLVPIVLEFHQSQRDNGVFNLLRPDEAAVSAWGAAAYDGWWASSGFGAVLYCSVLVYGMYLITQQNLVGLVLIRLLWANRFRFQFGADEANRDGHWGWASVRAALGSVYSELAVHGIALAAVFATLSGASIRGPAAVAWVQWAVVLPLYLIFPFRLVRRTITSYKTREEERLLHLRFAAEGRPAHKRIRVQEAIDSRIDRVRSIPILPFKATKDVALFVMGLTADAAAVYALTRPLFPN